MALWMLSFLSRRSFKRREEHSTLEPVLLKEASQEVDEDMRERERQRSTEKMLFSSPAAGLVSYMSFDTQDRQKEEEQDLYISYSYDSSSYLSLP